MKSSTRLRAVPWLLSLLALAACQGLSGEGTLDKATSLSAEETDSKVTFDTLRQKDPQSKIGAVEHPKILATNGGAYENQKLETMLALITGRLVAVSNDPGRAYDITVLNSPSINAFALPGGYLYVTRGLLALANDSSEVAAVLAHEMAHVASNHGVERSNQAKAVDIAGRVAKNVVSNPVAGKVAEASTNQRLVAFSQRQELQADAVGIKMLVKAGFDPFGAARFLESMDRYAKWRSALNNPNNDMSRTHPSTPKRIELARRHARAAGPPGTRGRDRKRFLQGINGMQFGGSAKDGYIRGQTFSHARLGIRFQVPVDYELTNKAKAVIATGPDQVALRFDAVNKKGQPSSVAAYLKSGWVNGLIKQSVTTTSVNGLPAAMARAQTGDWQFFIAAVGYRTRYYRFILAAPRSNPDIYATGQAITRTFKSMTNAEKAALKPLSIKLMTVKKGDTIGRLATQMQGVSRKVDLFKAMNGFGAGQRPQPGSTVKLIVE